ncbi:glycoside hydrolase family 125 protein [Baudoinia panamericana UAMH 10762]|uniref:Glycoside hydrolase family 125 protein n=1 Tax=Baudoinia panamericana (strain UAMH 10762) TaxID=717646 RepID=M2MIG8_BAUPA|nr:glycoside hydrolase family 125 protein [Baudoinia panamericana UAMH 10762]EMC96461.1 glycoside hydrolase family 125 protein [Baudoinia panamericana UAMH 10762]
MTAAAAVATAQSVQSIPADCPSFYNYSLVPHGPFSGGIYNLSYMRPIPECRTFNSSVVESAVNSTAAGITDPDLRRLFINSYPNTLDTAIAWHGYANGSDEELTFVITGDINAMWLRDSANQMQSYLPLLTASNSSNSLASLYRGVINLQSRYILIDPYCNSFQPPVESGIEPSPNPSASDDMVTPNYTNTSVFECKYELDSLAAFLEVSTNYYNATQDATFFKKYNWVQAVESVLAVAQNMTVPTYQANGNVSTLSYSFTRLTNRASETTENGGLGNPFNNGTGLIRSFFRPSDDATIFQGFIPANMMFSRYLASAADIASVIGETALASQMSTLASNLRTAITNHGIVSSAMYGQIYAFEVDGYMGQNIMDDANIPSLLAAPFFGYLSVNDTVYQNTRKLLLSANNPYFMRGPVINSIGGAHDGPGFAWPMASIVRIFTSNDDAEIAQQLQEIVSSTDGLGLIHESINTFNVSDWTRQWFSWANGLFGQCILDLQDRKPQILKQSFQGNSTTTVGSTTVSGSSTTASTSGSAQSSTSPSSALSGSSTSGSSTSGASASGASASGASASGAASSGTPASLTSVSVSSTSGTSASGTPSATPSATSTGSNPPNSGSFGGSSWQRPGWTGGWWSET